MTPAQRALCANTLALDAYSPPAGTPEPLRVVATRTAWQLSDRLWARLYNMPAHPIGGDPLAQPFAGLARTILATRRALPAIGETAHVMHEHLRDALGAAHKGIQIGAAMRCEEVPPHPMRAQVRARAIMLAVRMHGRGGRVLAAVEVNSAYVALVEE